VYTAELGCGSVRTYEARSFVPTTGEWVPCRSHGYWVVVRRGRAQATASTGRYVPRVRPRCQPSSSTAARRHERRQVSVEEVARRIAARHDIDLVGAG
jgi:hypothetical protein